MQPLAPLIMCSSVVATAVGKSSPAAVVHALINGVDKRTAKGSVCRCGLGRCFDATSSIVWVGGLTAAHAIPSVAPAVHRVLDPILHEFAYSNASDGCPGSQRITATLDRPLATFWEHDLGVLALGSTAFAMHNDSITYRYAFASVGELLLDSYPTSPLTATYAQTAKLMTDGALGKNVSGLWATQGCSTNGTSLVDCGVVWAEDAVLASSLLAQSVAAYGADEVRARQMNPPHAMIMLRDSLLRCACTCVRAADRHGGSCQGRTAPASSHSPLANG